LGQRLNEPFYAIAFGKLAGIQYHAMTGPLFVVAALNAFPVRQIKANYIASTRLYAAPVFSLIRAHNLHVQQSCAAGVRHVKPPSPRKFDRIHGVSNHVEAQCQIIFRNRNGCMVSGIFGWMDL
jgi:hypothetical protein